MFSPDRRWQATTPQSRGETLDRGASSSSGRPQYGDGADLQQLVYATGLAGRSSEASGTASRGLAASRVLPRMQRSSRMAFLPCSAHGQAAQSKHYLTVPPHAATRRSPAKRLAITDEASPLVLRSTRNRPRTALHRGGVDSSWLRAAGDDAASLRARDLPETALRATSPRPTTQPLDSAFRLRRCVGT